MSIIATEMGATESFMWRVERGKISMGERFSAHAKESYRMTDADFDQLVATKGSPESDMRILADGLIEVAIIMGLTLDKESSRIKSTKDASLDIRAIDAPSLYATLHLLENRIALMLSEEEQS